MHALRKGDVTFGMVMHILVPREQIARAILTHALALREIKLLVSHDLVVHEF